MSRFNAPTMTRTENLAGGEAFTESAELELASILLTSFVQDKFYRTAQDEMTRVKQLVEQVDPVYAAKAAIFARNEYGMRSISHVLAVANARRIAGRPEAKHFYRQVVRRPDDMTEIMALYGGKPFPRAMIRGFSEAFAKFDGYQIAKYRGEGKKFSLVDDVNLTHPVPVTKNAGSLSALVNGTLRSLATWETGLTQAGQKAQTDQEKQENKAETWRQLLIQHKLGYMAALKNIRNICEQAPDQIDALCELLTDEKMIRGSLVLPFRYQTALENLHGPVDQRVMGAIERAVDISLANVPKWEGRTLVVLDESGSMQGRPFTIGSMFAAALVKANGADFATFSNQARWRSFTPNTPVMAVVRMLAQDFIGSGTRLSAVFEGLQHSYDRIIILSDMQSWMEGDTFFNQRPTKEYEAYKRRTGADPHLFSFDLAGYGTLQFPERQVYCIAGFSEKVFDLMGALEEDRQALVNRIKAVEL